VQFAEDVGDVSLGRTRRNHEFVRNLAVAVPARYKSRDISFSRCKWLVHMGVHGAQ